MARCTVRCMWERARKDRPASRVKPGVTGARRLAVKAGRPAYNRASGLQSVAGTTVAGTLKVGVHKPRAPAVPMPT